MNTKLIRKVNSSKNKENLRDDDEFDIIIKYATLSIKERSIDKNDMDAAWKIDLLATLKDPYVDAQLAKSSCASEGLLERYAQHSSSRVRLNVASNTTTPKPVLELLANDRYEQIASVAKQRLATGQFLRRVSLK